MTRASSVEPEFSRLQRYFWPVHNHELKKLMGMLVMAFFIGFVYAVLRNMKDALLVTAQHSGAEVIPFVKLWALLPMAVLLTSIFIRLSHRYSTQKVFYLVISGFLGFFLLFAFVLYPLQDSLHPHAMADWLHERLPQGFYGMIAMLRYWSFSIFYCMCELWGVVVLTLLFWGFANEVMKVGEATRFYALLGIGANLSSVAAGQVACFLSSRAYNPNWPIGTDRWHQTLILLTLSITAAGLIVMVIFRWFNQRVASTGSDPAANHNKKLEKLEHKPSFRRSVVQLFQSRYLLSIGIMVTAYNVVINLVEVLWKGQIRLLHSDPNAYSHYMGQITTITGVLATFMAVLVAGNVIRKCGWTVTALVTPFMLIITSIGFFTFYLVPDHRLLGITALLGTTPIALVAFFGSAQNILSRACKYTVFDATKEIAFIPLDRQNRVRGKATIDGVASRMGKSGGAVIYQGLLMTFRTLTASAPYVAGILVGVLSAWWLSVSSVGRQFRRLQAGQPSSDPTPTPPKAAQQQTA